MRPIAGQFKPLNLIIAALLLLTAIGGFLWRSNQISGVKPDAERPMTQTALVYDYAGIIKTPDPSLNQSLRALQKVHGTEVIIVTVGREPHEMTLAQLAHKLIENWQIGTNHNQRGILVLVATESKKLQIGVSAGLSEIYSEAFRRHFQGWQWPAIMAAGKTTAALLQVLTEINTRADLTRDRLPKSAEIQRFDRNLPPGPLLAQKPKKTAGVEH